MKEITLLNSIFMNLDRWRNYPSYKLENRIDHFLSLYVPQLIQNDKQIDVVDFVIPEFPLKLSENNQSNKVDFIAFSVKREIAFMVELKTDIDSFGEDQYRFLEKARKKNFQEHLSDLILISSASDFKEKYAHLFYLLEDLGYLENTKVLIDKIYNDKGNRKGLKELYLGEYVAPRNTEVQTIYIVPDVSDFKKTYVKIHEEIKNDDKVTLYDFAEIIKVINLKFPDALSKLISQYLERWKSRPATDRPTY